MGTVKNWYLYITCPRNPYNRLWRGGTDLGLTARNRDMTLKKAMCILVSEELFISQRVNFYNKWPGPVLRQSDPNSKLHLLLHRQVPNPLILSPFTQLKTKVFALGYIINTSNLTFPKSNLPSFSFKFILVSLSVKCREPTSKPEALECLPIFQFE